MVSKGKKNIDYEAKIKAICSYFNVSEDIAKYMFHRRRRGYPWKKEGEPNYLKWNIPIQNAFVKAADTNVIDWGELRFNDDIQTLAENGFNVKEQANVIYTNKRQIQSIKEDNDGWTVVSSKKPQLVQKHILRSMGFLPKNKQIIKRSAVMN